VAFELKTVRFEPEHLGKLAFCLEALDRDRKRRHETPSIGVLLCRSKDDEVVKYALSRHLSPALVAQYETQMIPKAVLQQKLHEWSLMLRRPMGPKAKRHEPAPIDEIDSHPIGTATLRAFPSDCGNCNGQPVRCDFFPELFAQEPSAPLPGFLKIGKIRYPTRHILGYGGFRRIHARSCRSAWYSVIRLDLRCWKSYMKLSL
jgi:hypothetical protein